MTTTPTTTRLLDNYVGGRWTPWSSSEAVPVTNPATGETLALAASSSGPPGDQYCQAS
jgi:acyl-CoA reductase-like NAD-dependent aldehyde dehydrogenase